MLPHEVVSNAGIHGGVRPNPRPHSRQVEPSLSRANGRIGSALRQAAAANNSSDGSGRPFISKHQVLSDGGLLNLTHPVVGKNLGSAATGGSPVRRPGRPETGGGTVKVMPRRVGNAYINPKTVTIGSSATKGHEMSPPRAQSPPAAGLSPQRSVSPARHAMPEAMSSFDIGEAYRDQIVRPASRYAVASAQAHKRPLPASMATLSPHRSPVSKSRSKLTISQRLGISPSSVVSVVDRPDRTASSLTGGYERDTPSSALDRMIGNLIASSSRTRNSGRATISAFDEGLQSDEQVMYPFRVATGTTKADIVEFSNADEDVDVGLCIADLMASECLIADVKTLGIDVLVPPNTAVTHRPPELTLLPQHFITRPLIAANKSVPELVPSAHYVHHLVVDLTHWLDQGLAPIVTVPGLFALRGSINEHTIDRSLEFVVAASNQAMFLHGTPSIAHGALGSETGRERWLEGAGLVMVLNPNVSGSTRLTVSLIDNAAIDDETGCALSSSEVFVVLVHITKNGVVQGTGASAHPSKGSATKQAADSSSNNSAVGSLLPAPFLATLGISSSSMVDVSLPPLATLPTADAARVIRPSIPSPESDHYDAASASHPYIPLQLASRAEATDDHHIAALSLLDTIVPAWENTRRLNHVSTSANAPLSECFERESKHRNFCAIPDEVEVEGEGGDEVAPRRIPRAACKVDAPSEGDLYAAYDFPRMNAFSLRNSEMTRNEIECCDKALGRLGGGGVYISPFTLAVHPLAPSVAPCVQSALTPFEVMRFPYRREERLALMAMYSSSESPRRGDQEAHLRNRVDELYASANAGSVFQTPNSHIGAEEEYDPIAGEHLVTSMLDLASLHIQMALGDQFTDSQAPSLNAHANEAVELFEHVARLQGFAIGLHTAAMVGTAELQLAPQAKSGKSEAEQAAECVVRCEALIETLTTAATFLKHMGRLTEAIQMLSAARVASETYLGGENPFTLRSMTQLAECHYLQGSLLNAADVLRRAIELAGILVGSDSSTAANLELLLALVLGDLGDGPLAVELTQRVIRSRESEVAVLGSSQLATDPNLITAKFRLAQALTVFAMVEGQMHRSALVARNVQNELATSESSTPHAPLSPLEEAADVIRDVLASQKDCGSRAKGLPLDEHERTSQRAKKTDAAMLFLILGRAAAVADIPMASPYAAEAAVLILKSVGSKKRACAVESQPFVDVEDGAATNALLIHSDAEDSSDDDSSDERGGVSVPIAISAAISQLASSEPPSRRLEGEAALALTDVVIASIVGNMALANHAALEQVVLLCHQSLVWEFGPASLPAIRSLLLLSQLLRYKDWRKSLTLCQRARNALSDVVSHGDDGTLLAVPHADVIASESSLAHCLLAGLHSLCDNGRRYSQTLEQAQFAADRALEALQGIEDMCRQHHNSPSSGTSRHSSSLVSTNIRNQRSFETTYLASTDVLSEWNVEPTIVAAYSAALRPVPVPVATRLLSRIQFTQRHHGETSLRLVEPFFMLGVVHYNECDYTGAHHFLSKALKCADTINFLFLLGHLFKPAAQLTTSDAAERNRVAKERLQIGQALQFAAILFAIGSTYSAQGAREDAQTTFLQSLAALELAQCGHSLATAHVLASLSKLLYEEGHYGDALAHVQKAAALVDEYHTSIGEDAVNNASNISEVGALYSKSELDEILRVIHIRLQGKGYVLSRHVDSNHRFMVHM